MNIFRYFWNLVGKVTDPIADWLIKFSIQKQKCEVCNKPSVEEYNNYGQREFICYKCSAQYNYTKDGGVAIL